MPQLGSDRNPLIMKNPKKGNRKLVQAGGNKRTAEERQRYKDNWEVIFGNKKK